MQIPAWAAQKLGPLPVWGWGALAFSGGVGYVVYRRRSSSSASPRLASAAQAVPAKFSTASDAGGGGSAGGGSSSGGGPGSSTGPGIGGGSVVVSPGTGTGTGPRAGTGSGASSSGGGTSSFSGTAENPIYRAQPAIVAQPDVGQPVVTIAPSLLGGGYEASRGVVSNPAGIADKLAAISGGSYSPSLTDYASEQPGGIQTVQAGLPGTQPSQGLTYSIYGTNTGTGPVVPASKRIAGERYDALGRVIM